MGKMGKEQAGLLEGSHMESGGADKLQCTVKHMSEYGTVGLIAYSTLELIRKSIHTEQ